MFYFSYKFFNHNKININNEWLKINDKKNNSIASSNDFGKNEINNLIYCLFIGDSQIKEKK